MAMHSFPSMAFKISSLLILAVLLHILHTEAQVGVCYGRNYANNLPPPEKVVQLYEQYKIGSMRLYEPNQATLKALQGTNIKLMLGVSNQDIIAIACDQLKANEWVQTNVVPYASSIKFKYIAVGNEIKPWDLQASYMAQAMQNILNALNSNKVLLGTQIIVSTAIDSGLLHNTSPPSSSEFQNLTYITPIIKFLTDNNWPLLANIQPFIAYLNNPQNISLDFELFTSCGPKFIDPVTGKGYQNLFDALYDAVYIAIQKVENMICQNNSNNNMKRNGGNKPTASEAAHASQRGFHHPPTNSENNKDSKITTRKEINEENNKDSRFTTREEMNKENGTPSCGCGYPKSGEIATVENARIFYTNMIKHVKEGTPLTQGEELEVFLFEMFDENLKPGDESEQHYGLFTPDGKPKYGITNFQV